MALVSFAKRIIFCPSAGTASTSMCRFLMQNADFQWVPAQDFARDGYHVDRKHSGLPALVKFALLDLGFIRTAWSFALVRHPFSWYLSEFLRHRLWIDLLNDASSWIYDDPVVRHRIVAAQGDFLPFCQLMMQHNRPPDISAHVTSWDLFHWTVTGCSAVFRYENMPRVQGELIRRLGLPDGCFPYVNKTPVPTSLRDNLDMFSPAAAALIRKTHQTTFARYGYQADLAIAARTEPIMVVPGALPDDFSATRYLELNPDLQEVGIAPAQHYLAYGQFELRQYK